jgi:polysaccharide biosynthesis/export protein ExoF
MLALIKRSIVALVATIAIPSSFHHPGPMEPSDSNDASVRPAAADQDAMTSAPDISARQADQGRTDEIKATEAQAAGDDSRLDAAVAIQTPIPLGGLPLAVGDKVKIGVYESIGTGGGGTAPRSFYQRMDIGGDYTVEQDGSISVPLLGQFQAEGRSTDEVRAALEASFMTVFRRNAMVDLRIVDRPPIYVVGPVKSPGAYKYVPGMIALQAIALAGGVDRGMGAVANVEGAREMERARMAAFQIQGLVARRARLQAERDSAGSISAASASDTKAMTALAALRQAQPDRGSDDPESLVATESTILQAKEARRREDENEVSLKIAAAQGEVDALKHKLEQFDLQSGLMKQRLASMQKLQDRGLVTSSNVVVLQTELADLEMRRQDSLAATGAAKTRRLEAEGEGRKLEIDAAADIAREMEGIDREIGMARETVTSAITLAAMLRPVSACAPTYEIVRQSKSGPDAIPATETSPLTPGDVLKVKCGDASDTDATNARQHALGAQVQR